MVALFISAARKLALKIASYGVMHLVVAILVAFAITRDVRMALAIGMVEPFFQTIAYTIHDRIWHVIEKRRLATGLEEAAEAFSSRLGVMSPDEQMRVHGHKHGHAHGHHGHSHALPRSFKQIAVKTLTYGLMHFTVAVAVAFALTGNIRASLAIGIIEPLVQTVFFTLHDRFWTRIENRKAAEKAALTEQRTALR
ncbi:DUF2061 domain-containing protein [Brevundimonas pishanensis]|uniref:DUF2061 domain-containing protein n=1 Tax=Brevundimonas pishanensis TaxID=2896315 RepID=UPI001FA7552A|nr:DUF2061 domain-containing protein [Brevundimonas pishanensis]